MAKAEISIPWLPWLPMRVVVDHVARHLSCTPEDACLRIVQAGEARRIKACSLTVEGWPVSLLPAAWRGIDGDADVDLRLDALIAAGLLPAPAEPVRWSAQEGIAYIIEGMPLEGKEWTAEMVRQTERGEIALGGVIGVSMRELLACPDSKGVLGTLGILNVFVCPPPRSLFRNVRPSTRLLS